MSPARSVPPPGPPVVSYCGCGRNYTADTWLALPSAGHTPSADDGLLSLRNCVCGSTHAVEIGALEMREVLRVLVGRAKRLAVYPGAKGPSFGVWMAILEIEGALAGRTMRRAA